MLHTWNAPGDFNAATAAAEFDRATALWHTPDDPGDEQHPALRLHRANFTLWHLEDEARDPLATDAAIAQVKRAIDRTNQQRNDVAESIDVALLGVLAAAALPNASAPLHSETPGMMLDRLSILALKRFHTQEQVERSDATEEHRQANRARLAVLEEQSSDLAACLVTLWGEVLAGTRRFKSYRQMKMYNDPALNPVLYRSGGRKV